MANEGKKSMRKLAVETTEDGKVSLTIGRSNPVIEDEEFTDLVTLMIAYTYMKEKGVTGLSFEEGKFSLSGPMEIVSEIMTQMRGDKIASGEILGPVPAPPEEAGIPTGGEGDPNAPPMPPPNKPSKSKK